MAEIKIEHKQSSGAWLWWIVGLIVLAAILWWLFASSGNDRTAAVGDTVTPVATAAGGEAMATGSAASGTVTDLAALEATSAGDLAGRPVALQGVPVQDVVSDRGFWLGSATQRVFAIRTDQSSPSTPPNGAVNAGQTVNVYGTVQRMPTDLSQQSTAWNLRSTDSSALAGQPVYVAADSVQIVSR